MAKAHAGPARPIRSCPIAHPKSHLKSPVHPICHAGPAHLLSYACHIVHLFPEDWNALHSCFICFNKNKVAAIKL